MSKKSVFFKERDGARSNTSRRKRIAVLFLILLLSAFLARGGGAARADCYEQCQLELALCMLRAQQDPIMELQCQNDYDRCIEGCDLE